MRKNWLCFSWVSLMLAVSGGCDGPADKTPDTSHFAQKKSRLGSECTRSSQPSLVTDREDYTQGLTVNLVGKGLNCGEVYRLVITRPDETSISWQLTADDTGSVYGTYVFDGQVGDYEAELLDGSDTVVAHAHFHGSHFRYGHLTWRPVGPRTAEFTLINAFRRDYPGSGPDGRVVTGDQFTEDIGGTPLCFGDGSCTGTLSYEVISYSLEQNWVIGRAVNPGRYQSLPPTGLVRQEIEPNNTFENANPLDVGDDYSSTINEAGDRDLMRFSLTQPRRVSISTHLLTLSDSILLLYGGDGSLIAFHDDSGGGTTERMELDLSAGTYFIEVGGYANNSGSVRVELREQQFQPAGPLVHTYGSDEPQLAYIFSCCRIGGLVNENVQYRVETTVRFDEPNGSPVSSLPPIIKAPVNTPNFSFRIPAIDPEGDALSFRLATDMESGIVNPIPRLSVDSTGLVTWDTRGTFPEQLWTTQIVIEERRNGQLIGSSAVDFIIEMVNSVGTAPSCELSQQSFTVRPGERIHFTVSGTDPDPDTLTLNTEGLPSGAALLPALPLQGPSGVSSAFEWIPPDSAENTVHVVGFTVTDSNGLTDQCAVSLRILGKQTNQPPVADAGPDQLVAEGGMVLLDGSGSSDPEGHGLTFSWSQVSSTGPVVTLSSTTVATPAFLASDDGVYTFLLTVTDEQGLTSSETVTITVANVAPSVAAASDAPQYWGLPVHFTGSASDPSSADTAAGFNPTWAPGDSSTLAGFTAVHAYDAPGTYQAVLSATDKDGASGSASALVEIRKRPTSLSCGAASAVFGFPALLGAQLGDVLPEARLGGRSLTFRLGESVLGSVTTDEAGRGQVHNPPLLMPGTHTVTVSFEEDSHYTASQASCTLTIINSSGKITAGTLRMADEARGGFNVQLDDLGQLKGELQFHKGPASFHAHTLTALGISADKRKAWFAGVGQDGVTFTAYVEDNGEPGGEDVFKLWLGGVLRNGNGRLSGGNVEIH